MRKIGKTQVTYFALEEYLYKRYEGKVIDREMFKLISSSKFIISNLLCPCELGTKTLTKEFLDTLKVLGLEEEESKDPLLKDFKEAVIKDFIENNEGIKMTNQHGVEKFYVNPKFW